MLASSSTFWMRLATAACSPTSWARCRVRSRSSRIGARRHEAGLAAGRAAAAGRSTRQSLTSVLRPGHLLDVLGVDQQQLEAALQQVEDRLPVDAGRLHGDVGDALRRPASRPAPAGRRSWCAKVRTSCGPTWPSVRRGGRRRRRSPCGRPIRAQRAIKIHRSGPEPPSPGDIAGGANLLDVLPGRPGATFGFERRPGQTVPGVRDTNGTRTSPGESGRVQRYPKRASFFP